MTYLTVVRYRSVGRVRQQAQDVVTPTCRDECQRIVTAAALLDVAVWTSPVTQPVIVIIIIINMTHSLTHSITQSIKLCVSRAVSEFGSGSGRNPAIFANPADIQLRSKLGRIRNFAGFGKLSLNNTNLNDSFVQNLFPTTYNYNINGMCHFVRVR